MFSTKSAIKYCIVAVIVLLPLSHLKVILFGIPLYSVEMPLIVALVAYWYGRQHGTFLPVKSINFRNPIAIGIGLFFLGAVVSFLANPFSLTGLGMLKTWFIFPLFMVWLFLQSQPDEKERNFILNTWLVVTLLVACGALAHALVGNLTYDGRLAAWFGSPNYLAIFIAPGILIAFYKLQKSLEEKKQWKETLLFIVCFFILLAALYFTHSFGVWFGVFGSVVLMTLLSPQTFAKKHFLKILVVVVILGSLFFFFEHNNPKWQSLVVFENRSSLISRVMIWQSAGKMIADNPIFGIGLGRFQEVYLEYQKYYPPYLEWAVPEPHNIILAVWLQTGLLGFFGFVLLITRAIYILIKNKNQESILLLGLLALYLLYGIFDTPYFKTDLAFAFWLVIALGFSYLKQPETFLPKK